MSKGPTPRHSKPPQPVTIDLDATDVTPKTENPASKPAASGPATSAPVTAAPAAAKSALSTPTTAEAAAGPGGKLGDAGTFPKSAVPGIKAEPDSADDARSGADTSVTAAKAGPAPTSPPQPAPSPADARTNPSASAAKPDAQATDAKADAPSGSGKTGTGAPARPAASPARSNGIGLVASGLVGAVIALGAGYALQAGGLLPSPGRSGDQVQALSARLDGVSASVETLSTQMADSAGGTAADMSAQLTARLDRLETGLSEISAGVAAGDPAETADLAERLSALEDRIAALGEGGAADSDPALAAEIGELRAAQSGLQAALNELQGQSSAQFSELSERIATLDQGQAELADQLDEPGRQIDLARAIAAAGLKSAIDRGGSFMSELEAFATVAPDDPAVPELRDLAASGVPSRSSLIEGFPEAATTAIAAADPVDPDAGLVDRLMSSALSVVKVRRVGEVEGDTAEAIAARAEARLMDGDLDAALAEWNQLPEASRAAASVYGEALAARARAEKLIAASMAPAGTPASSEAPAN